MYSLLLCNLTFWCFHYNKPQHLREEGESIRMQELLNESLERRGGARNVPTGGSSSDEVAKIWFSGYYKGQKFPKKSLFTFQRGASMLRRGL